MTATLLPKTRHAAQAITLSGGEVVFREREPSNGRMYLVEDGAIAISREQSTLATLGPGQLFGELGMLDEQPRSATARAVCPTRVIPVDAEEFKEILLRQPGLALDVMRVLASRVRASLAQPASDVQRRTS